MANRKERKNNIVISPKLKKRLSVLRDSSWTIVEAPTGYGKTVVLQSYLKSLDVRTLWIDASGSFEDFSLNFYSAVLPFDVQLARKIKEFGITRFLKNSFELLEEIYHTEILEETVIVLDGYRFWEREFDCLRLLLTLKLAKLRFVVITRKVLSKEIKALIAKKTIAYLPTELFLFTLQDTQDYFRRYGVLVNMQDLDAFYRQSKGWPIIIKIQMDNMAAGKPAEILTEINTFLMDNIWQQLEKEEKSLCVKLCLLPEFTFFQAVEISGLDKYQIKKILNSNEFIQYNPKDFTYQFNSLFLSFVRDIFDNLWIGYKREIAVKTGNNLQDSGNYYGAMECYYIVKEFSLIYKLDISVGDIYQYIVINNKQKFLDIAKKCCEFSRLECFQTPTVLCYALFLYNEKFIMNNLMDKILHDMEKCELDQAQENMIRAKITFISAFNEFNRFDKMKVYYMKIFDIIKGPIDLIDSRVPFSFGVPSILTLYHTYSGMLNHEYSMCEDFAPAYYRITNGHGKGYEAIVKAEILYNRGEFESADILCHKAIYMSDSRNQLSNHICTLLLLSRLAIFDGDIYKYHEYTSQLLSIADNDNFNFKMMTELAYSFLGATIESPDLICQWLKEHRLIENNNHFITLCYSGIIYGKYLLLNKEYHKFLGISGQLLGLTNVYSYITSRIYIYIYIAIANQKINELNKAFKFLREAVELAEKDELVMPFVENYKFIEELLIDGILIKDFPNFIKKIRKIARNYCHGLSIIQKAIWSAENMGLTKREAEIAKLAALRLSNKEIADNLFIAESTVKSSMKAIFSKLSINSRTDLAHIFK